MFDDATLSYRELDERANQLAHHLRALGAGPETVVALCVERSFDMVIALLAILKAGAAYLPLDPDYPEERLARDDRARAAARTAHAQLAPRKVRRATPQTASLSTNSMCRISRSRLPPSD